jgi:ribonuclease P protein component
MDSSFRLTRSVDFQRAYRSSRRCDGRFMVVHCAANSLDHPRVGFTVSTKVGGSVQRNLVRRRLREALRPLIRGSREAVDLVVVARPEALSAGFAELAAELRELTGKLISL